MKKNFINDIKDSNDYLNINYILRDINLTLENKQLKIENYIFNNWVDDFIKNLSLSKNLFNSNIGLDMLKDSIKNLNDIIEEYKNNKKYSKGKLYFNLIKLVNNNDIISIVLRNVIPKLFKHNELIEQNITSLFEKVGKEIINNICLLKYNNYVNNINLINNIKLDSNLNYIDFKNLFIEKFILYYEDMNEYDLYNYVNNLDYLIGGDLVEFFSINSSIYKMINKTNEENKTYRTILPDSYLSDLFCKHMIYASQKLPMIVKPNDWVLNINNEIKDYGGYITNVNNKHHLIHKSYKNIGTTKFINNDNINSINYLQNVPFIINKDLLNYLLDCINNNDLINKILNLNLHPETKNLFNLSIKKKDILVKEILYNNSKYYENKINISVAILLQDYIFYHPLFMDWRGRIYTHSTVLSFQSNELSRSLIMFKDGFKLNEKGLESLQIYLANCYGLNKKSKIDRINWTIKNKDNIINCKANFFWMSAKEPFLFLSACIEYINVINDDNYLSKLPIYIDATCNGLQHLAAMTNDINLGKYVNLLKSTNEEIPSDIYKEMSNKVIINIKNLVDNLSNGKDYIKLTKLNINRSFIKRGIMTISYGSTVRGIYDQLMEGGSKQFEYIGIENNRKIYSIIDSSICDSNISFTKKEIIKLASIIHDVLFLSYPSLKILVNYFIEMNNLIHKLNLPIIWKTPSGLIIEQKYIQTINKEIRFSVLGKNKSITIKTKTNKINTRKQNLGIMPNIVHSMDASNIILLIKNIKYLEYNNNIPILTIHDCFASNANFIELLSYHVKLAFLSIYKNRSFIDNYHEFIIHYLLNNNIIFNEDKTGVIIKPNKIIYLPVKPNLNTTLDLNDNILLSKYFIH